MTDIWGTRVPTKADRAAFRPSPVFLLIVAAFAGAGWALWSGTLPIADGAPGVFAFVLAGWLLSLCLHEYAHAVVAYRGGDHTIPAAGYLTLNPLKYTHAVFSIVLPLVFLVIGGIGLPGGAVYINRALLRGRVRESLVSAAGPLTNVAFALALLLPTALLWRDTGTTGFWAAVAFLGFLQMTAAVLNLLPVPGFDGFGIIEPWLSAEDRALAAKIGPFGMLVLFMLLLVPALNNAFFRGIFFLVDALGVPAGLAGAGLDLFRFW
jgi:Zn-dependent protease